MFKKSIVYLVLLMCASLQSVQARIYPFTENNKLTLLEEPKAAVELKLEMVRQARHHIHITTYFWDDSTFPKRLADELVKANERGVEVRILTTYFPSITTDLASRSKRWLRPKSSTTVFNYLRLKPTNSIVLSNNLHEKIFLVDGEKAILGGRNIADSSMRGKDMEVLLEGPVVNQVQEHFRLVHDFLLDLEIQDKCKNDLQECLKHYLELSKTRFQKNDSDFFPVQPLFEKGIQARILTHDAVLKQYKFNYNIKERSKMPDDIISTIIGTKFKKLRGYNYFIFPLPDYKEFLEKNIKEGNEIQLITNSQRSAAFVSNKGYLYSLPELRDLAKKGISIFQWQGDGEMEYLHEKVMIFDEDHVFIGSHNFGKGSTAVSNEIAIEFTSPEIAKRLIEVFDSEISDIKLTKKAKESTLLDEMNAHLKWVKFLRTGVIGDILQEFY
jgi:putative cardiolipin synthase